MKPSLIANFTCIQAFALSFAATFFGKSKETAQLHEVVLRLYVRAGTRL